MDSVKELCAWLCQKYELAPTRKGVIVGHQNLNDDADCPGMHLYKRLPEIRQFCEDKREQTVILSQPMEGISWKNHFRFPSPAAVS